MQPTNPRDQKELPAVGVSPGNRHDRGKLDEDGDWTLPFIAPLHPDPKSKV
eukprot:CAMPEP_0172695740 /NCGR_PEP_ID=MMETSP1074-20121228/27571_1 /TAXON_ID=2916 /ORGANISM="Ceratium fusus, Strain PA161109" /LENGTH=50 /DNA_ID=CAMNT_0013516401 /DNA_START=11 /DNA_END=163 /DNA_ORIENTATION=+